MTTPDDTYTHGHADAVLRSHRWRTVENSAGYLISAMRPGASLLDVGCGPGTITVDLARRVAPGHVIGIDRAAAVIAEASAHAVGAGVENVEFRTGNVYALDFGDGCMDVVHAHQVLQHLSHPVDALREMRRVCRPDGVVAVRDSDYGAMRWFPADPLLDRWLELYCAVARANDAEPDAGRKLLSWAREAAFGTIEPSASVWCFATPADRAWWGELWAERISSTTLAEQLLAGGHADQQELAAIAGAWRRWSTDPDGWFVVVHGELRCRP